MSKSSRVFWLVVVALFCVSAFFALHVEERRGADRTPASAQATP